MSRAPMIIGLMCACALIWLGLLSINQTSSAAAQVTPTIDLYLPHIMRGWNMAFTPVPTTTPEPPATATETLTPPATSSVVTGASSTATATITSTNTSTATATIAPTNTSTATVTQVPSLTPTQGLTTSPTATPSASTTATPTFLSSPSPSLTVTTVPVDTLTPTATHTRTAIPTTTRTLAPTMSPTVTTPAVTPGVVILPNHSHNEYPGYITVQGEVRNTFPLSLTLIRVFAEVTDFNGNVVSEGSGYVPISHLLPGETSCFSIFLTRPASIYRYRITSWSAYYATTSPARLTAYDVDISGDSNSGSYTFSGQIRNDDTRRVVSAGAVLTLYRANGQVLDCKSAYPVNSTLDPGESRRFSTTFFLPPFTAIGSRRIQVSG